MHLRPLVGTVVAGLVLSSTMAARPQEMVTRAILVDETGQSRVGTQARKVRPRKPDSGFGTAAFVYRNHNVKDQKGRVVSGLSVVAWEDGDRVRVAVYTLVPRRGVPNTYLGQRETAGYLEMADFVEFALAVGEKRELIELSRLGLEPWTIKIERVPRR